MNKCRLRGQGRGGSALGPTRSTPPFSKPSSGVGQALRNPALQPVSNSSPCPAPEQAQGPRTTGPPELRVGSGMHGPRVQCSRSCLLRDSNPPTNRPAQRASDRGAASQAALQDHQDTQTRAKGVGIPVACLWFKNRKSSRGISKLLTDHKADPAIKGR